MFERFTGRARQVVVLAQEEARMLGHGYIGTEHILLGLLAEGEGPAAQALTALGISLDAAREQVAEIVGEGAGAPSGHIPFTGRAKKVLELSLREAQRLGDSYIDTEHILLGVAREGRGRRRPGPGPAGRRHGPGAGPGADDQTDGAGRGTPAGVDRTDAGRAPGQAPRGDEPPGRDRRAAHRDREPAG